MKFLRFDPVRHAQYERQIAALELLATYPLGADSFKIEHGADYFAFFRRLGQLHYYFALDGDRVAAVGAGVLRSVPVRAWYLCDLKVHPDYRGRQLPLRMLSRAFLPNYFRCRRGYAVTMNPNDGTPNRIVRLISHFRWTPSRLATTLAVFSLDAQAMQEHQSLLERHRGPVTYLSLTAKKDIVLESTGKALPLLHVQFGTCAERGQPQPASAHTHMFCAPTNDALTLELAQRGVVPTATASVIQHGMNKMDWRFILTSDI